MVLISFLYIVTTKVIQHNLEKKVPMYVYYLYKNLENESKLLTKKIANNPENTGKTIEEIFSDMTAHEYCEFFSKDINIVGDVDCKAKDMEQSVTLNEDVAYKNINVLIQNNLKRDISYNVNDDGTPNITYTPVRPSDYDTNKTPLCSSITNSIDRQTCYYTPNATYLNLITNQKVEQLYKYVGTQSILKIDGVENTDLIVSVNDNASNADIKIDTNKETVELSQNAEAILKEKTEPGSSNTSFNIDEGINFSTLSPTLRTLNNINLKLIRMNYELPDSAKGTLIYNIQNDYTTTYNQDAICPVVDDIDISKKEKHECYWSNKKTNGKTVTYSILYSDYTNTKDNKHGCMLKMRYKKNFGYASGVYENYIEDYCSGYNEKNKHFTCEEHKTYAYNIYSNIHNKSYSVGLGGVSGTVNMEIVFNDYYKAYYTKWKDFFLTIDEISSTSSEMEGPIKVSQFKYSGSVNKPSAHFIYASIDTPFSEGEMNKNIFVFEQFGNKIIPVGYLANNQNTPLKFDVITRDPQTFKIEKVNDKPLNFCEAMKYTSDKFSQYCGCKDEDNNIVTEFSKIEVCNNHFGCIIRPIKPSSSSWF